MHKKKLKEKKLFHCRNFQCFWFQILFMEIYNKFRIEIFFKFQNQNFVKKKFMTTILFLKNHFLQFVKIYEVIIYALILYFGVLYAKNNFLDFCTFWFLWLKMRKKVIQVHWKNLEWFKVSWLFCIKCSEIRIYRIRTFNPWQHFF